MLLERLDQRIVDLRQRNVHPLVEADDAAHHGAVGACSALLSAALQLAGEGLGIARQLIGPFALAVEAHQIPDVVIPLLL